MTCQRNTSMNFRALTRYKTKTTKINFNSETKKFEFFNT